jgi:hypothetical protein
MDLHEKSIALLEQEIANYQNLYTEYLNLLRGAFPEITELQYYETSVTLRHLKNYQNRCFKNLKYVKENKCILCYFGLTDSTLEAVRQRSQKHDPDTFLKAFNKMQNMYQRQRWGLPEGIDIKYIEKANTIPLALWWRYFDKSTGQIYRSKERGYWLDSFLLKPKFKAGDIVSIRSNIPDGAIKYEYDWGNGRSDLRVMRIDSTFKAKTFMVIGEDNKRSNYYEKAYKPNGQGGMRRYKLLPVGDTRVYWGIERALKINRTKAVKDAKTKAKKK